MDQYSTIDCKLMTRQRLGSLQPISWFNVERNELVWQLIKCKVLQMIDDWSCMHYLPFLILDYPFAMTLFYTAE